MNWGYSNKGIDDNAVCPLCGSDVRISKFGSDYRCLNRDCILFENSHVVIKKILSILENREVE